MRQKVEAPVSVKFSRAKRGVVAPTPVRKPVIGIESEFTIYVRDEKRRPEHLFADPREIVRERMLPRTGRSYHLPSGGAIYFDTGVIEVATPIIEMESGCSIRAVHSLWDQIKFLRGELDAWEAQHGSDIRLEGFSTHYNLTVPPPRGRSARGMNRLSRVLLELLYAPVMLLAANRLSTGVGIRPRDQRVELTVDFTPDPELMIATACLVVGVVSQVISWNDLSVAAMRRRRFPAIKGFKPRRHTSRKGLLAHIECFSRNPFQTDPEEAVWKLADGRTVSLRALAHEIALPFRDSMLRFGDRQGVEHAFAVLSGGARSLLDFTIRPRQYEDVGRVIDWNRRRLRPLARSRYESVIHRIITHRPVRIGPAVYSPERMQGWYEVVFRDVQTGRRRVFNLDELVLHGAV